ncbi:MAG: CRISPR-associated endonuclease Cas1 [Spirochaetales bacterium]|nr:CRISPR-associated endonuclease Cas1 [Spirochaetales bacterium]
MSAAYIISDTGKLSKEGKHLVFRKADGTESSILLHKIDSIMIIGNVSISGDALRLISESELPITFTGRNGAFYGSLEYQTSKNVFLHQKQFQMYEDEKSKLKTAKSIVKGKIRNQMTFIQRIGRKNITKKDQQQIDNIMKQLKKMYAISEHAKNVGQLRGFEGTAAREYFSGFKLNIIPDWAVFSRRSRNPPKSNVNAALSFLYALLSQRVYNAIRLEGLHPMVGTLHEMSYGRDGLVYDIMEEFRIPICDTTCCSMFNHNVLSESDFRKMTFSDEDQNSDTGENEAAAEISDNSTDGIYLNDSGVEKVIGQFEEKLSGEIIYGASKVKMSIENVIIEQVKMYKRVLSGEEKEYVPFVMR